MYFTVLFFWPGCWSKRNREILLSFRPCALTHRAPKRKFKLLTKFYRLSFFDVILFVYTRIYSFRVPFFRSSILACIFTTFCWHTYKIYLKLQLIFLCSNFFIHLFIQKFLGSILWQEKCVYKFCFVNTKTLTWLWFEFPFVEYHLWTYCESDTFDGFDEQNWILFYHVDVEVLRFKRWTFFYTFCVVWLFPLWKFCNIFKKWMRVVLTIRPVVLVWSQTVNHDRQTPEYQ